MVGKQSRMSAVAIGKWVNLHQTVMKACQESITRGVFKSDFHVLYPCIIERLAE